MQTMRNQTGEGPSVAASLRYFFVFLLVFGLGQNPASGQAINVLTRNYDNQRTGANLGETSLNTSNVNPGQFRKLFMLSVDDQVYAAVLYVAGLNIAGGTHNVLYVATANNSVYAFDAETLGSPLWSRNFNGTGRPTMNSEVGTNCSGGYHDFIGNIGIVGTPVIDGVSGTIYFVTRTVENGGTVQRLRALDIITGLDRANSPQIIQASVPGTGDGENTTVFDPVKQNQRAALALSQGLVYIAWASFCDTTRYHGWVLAYNAASLAQVSTFNDTPNGSMGGIWMAGAAPAFDAGGAAYFSTGNGSFDGASGFGESMLKLAPSSLSLLDYFTPSNFNSLNDTDFDFGSAGPVLLPGTNFLASGGKEGKLYLLNTSNLGHETSGDIQIPQAFQAVDVTVRPNATHHLHNSAVTWNSPQGLNLYTWGENDYLRAFRFDTSTQKLKLPAVAAGSVLPSVGMPGGMMTLSANLSQSGTGVLWASTPRNGDANQFIVPGTLYAFNAETLALLWSSTGAGDDSLNFSKGSIPVVANGKVYLGSTSYFINVYGLSTSPPPPQNLALNKVTTSSPPCSTGQGPAQAVNGSATGGSTDKWCSTAASPFMTVDLGAAYPVTRFVIEHAGAGGEAFSSNTGSFNIQVGNDGVNFNTVVNVTGNSLSITTHDIPPTSARYVRLRVNGHANIYELQVFGSQAGLLSDFSLLTDPGTQTVPAGASATYTATVIPANGFGGAVVLSASGLPAGATSSFNPASVSGAGDSILTITASCSTPTGTFPITISGTSGGLQHTVGSTLTVTPGNILCPVYNRIGMVTDGTSFSSGGLDAHGNAYSANLLGSTVNFNGIALALGPANVPDAVTSATVPLPAGQYSNLTMLATGVNGKQTSQTFKVQYSDGTSSTFTQSLSDSFSPQNFAGESKAATMAYRDRSNGSRDVRTFYLYGYSFALNGAKTLSSIILPNNANVVVLAIALTPATVSADFGLSASPGSLTVTTGASAGYSATVAAVNGFADNVALSASGLPAGATAGFATNPVSGSGSSTLTISTSSSSTPAGTYTVTISGVSGSLQHTTTVTLVVASAPAPDFSLNATPGSLTVTAGANAGYTATVAAVNGFAGNVALSASGLPSGATAGFASNPVVGSGSSTLTISTSSSSTPAGTYTMTISGVSGSLQHTTTITLTVTAATSETVQVDLSSVYANVHTKVGMVTDGTSFSSSGGLDAHGSAYSATLLGSTVNFNGVAFALGPANAPDAVTSVTVPLAGGQFSKLTLLATAVNGNQTSKAFKVQYSDGTSSTFTQSLSDWFTPQNYAGESKAVTTAYRDQSNGTRDSRTFNLYGYSFALNATKTVSSIILPNNSNVLVLAMTLSQ